ncbi:class I SAM-dependent methyltransferase [Candidatus Poribacteria bacterium]|nr:class I SAM-dependent methyltransferase [Candidatus Poribacteria bacterium]
MSGTGRVSLPLIEGGVRLTCVDNSPEMLAILREKLKKRGLSADVYPMDVRELTLQKQFELVVIPFHSFAELLSLSDQRRTLEGIYQHLSETGRFICALHNPPVRLKSVDGQLRLLGKYPFENRQGTLLLWGLANYDAVNRTVSGLQFYEEYDINGIMQSKRVLEIRFCMLERGNFEELVTSIGFKVMVLYGDYSYSAFQEDTSPFMIWILQK